MGCLTGAGYAGVLANYSAHGWATACVNYFETPNGSGKVPYYLERDRLDASVAAVTAGAWAAAYWTGEDLLLQGISHGASSPLIAMARFGVDAQPSWQGTRATGGCFFDGTVNQSATEELLKTGAPDGRPCTFPVSYERWLARYCPQDPLHCNLSSNKEALMDLVADAPATNFSLKAWRLTECGSLMAPCTGDIIPMSPFQKLCAGIEAGPEHTCEFFRLPLDGHLTCHAHHGYECRLWFEGRFPAQSAPAAQRRSAVVSLQGDLANRSTPIPNWASTLTSWDPQSFGHAAPSDFSSRFPFLKYVELFTATGGCYRGYPGCTGDRDLFNDPAVGMPSGVNASRLFPPLWRLIDAGLTPHLVTGNVPIALSAEPFIGGFGFNSKPPSDLPTYRVYIRQVAEQLVKEFGLERVKAWRWGVFTEYNNQDWLIGNATSFAALFDHTACGLVDALGSPSFVDLGAHGCIQCQYGAWAPLEFLQHAAQGTSACNGGSRVHLNYTANSYYEHTIGEPGDGSWWADQGGAILSQARALGLPTQRYGIDEGRLLWGPEGSGYGLTTRAVGPAYQASWDALFFNQLVLTGVPDAYYSRWGLTFSPDHFAGASSTVDSVATNVARLTHALAGLPRVPTTLAPAAAGATGDGDGSPSPPASAVGAVVGVDATTSASSWVVRVLAYHHHPWLNASSVPIAPQTLQAALCGAPPGAVGNVPSASATRVGQLSANAWPAWAAAASAANLSFAAGDYNEGWSALSDTPPLRSARALGVLAAALPEMQAAARLLPGPLPGGASVGADACLRFAIELPPHEVALVEIALQV